MRKEGTITSWEITTTNLMLTIRSIQLIMWKMSFIKKYQSKKSTSKATMKSLTVSKILKNKLMIKNRVTVKLPQTNHTTSMKAKNKPSIQATQRKAKILRKCIMRME
jgi:hypothetical protein